MNAMYQKAIDRLVLGQPSVIQYSLRNNDTGPISSLEKELLIDGDLLAAETLRVGPRIDVRNEGSVFLEPIKPQERLIIFGAGHIALPLADFAERTGFSVVIVDDRPSFADARRFSKKARVVCEFFPKAFETLGLTERDYVVIITRGHTHDLECLAATLRGREPLYVGMIGSKKRVALARNELISQGVDEQKVSRLRSPIGMPIGAVTPAEIAIAIMAEIIQRKRLGSDTDAAVFSTDLDLSVVETIAQLSGERCAIVTIVSTDGSVPRGIGAKMIVYRDGRLVGSIGGGCGEAQATLAARDRIGSGTYELKTIDMTGSKAEENGMVCGGTMRVLIEDFTEQRV